MALDLFRSKAPALASSGQPTGPRAVSALEQAREVQRLAVEQHQVELAALAKAEKVAAEAEAELQACNGPGEASFSGLVRGRDSANAILEASGDRVERAAEAVKAAAAHVAATELKSRREQLAALDAQVRAKDAALSARARQLGAELADEVNALKQLVRQANALEKSLPGWKPSGNEMLGLGSDHRGSGWALYPMTDVDASPSSALASASAAAAS